MFMRLFNTYLFACGIGTIAGTFFTFAFSDVDIGSPADRLFIGAGFGMTLSAVMTTWFLLLYPKLKRVSFLVALVLNTIAVGTLLLLGNTFSAWAFLGGLQEAPFRLIYVEQFWQNDASLMTIFFGYGMTFSVLFLVSVSHLIGPKTLFSFLTGRYHQARREERIFLFVDLKGSTGLAEHLGDHRFHAFICRFFEDLTPPVAAHKGDFHRYIGDEALITFPVIRDRDGKLDNACLRALQDITTAFDNLAGDYRQRFGTVPEWRAGLHTGAVLTGEVGLMKQEIIFLGDVINTAARIASACRDMKEDILVSDNLLRQMALPDGMAKRDLGNHQVRGRDEAVHFFALDLINN